MRKQILVVDDEPSILELLRFIFTKQYDTVLKGNGYDAMLWLEMGNIPDLIILDMEMPYLNGAEFLKAVKVSGIFKDIPIIVLSVTANANMVSEIEMSNIPHYMKKPFNPTTLQQVAYSLLNHPQNESTINHR